MSVNRISVVLTTAFIFSLIIILPIILGFAKTPSGWQYLATGHYYLDYFVYLQSITQGIHGHLLFNNPFATNDPGKIFLVWWPYLIIGYAARLLHMSPIIAYWLSVFLLTFISVLLVYILISRLLEKELFSTKIIALIIFLISSAFLYLYKNTDGFHAIPVDFWYAPSSLFKRFEGVPHHLLGNALILTTMVIAENVLKKFKINSIILLFILLATTMTFYPYQVINLIIALSFTSVFINIRSIRNWVFSAVTLISMGLVGIYVRSLSMNSGLISRLNQSDINLTYYPTLSIILQTAGPILIFSLIGVGSYLKRMSPIKLLFLSYVLISWVLTFSPFASYVNNFNLRFLTPLSSVFLATTGILGIKKISNVLFRKSITIILLIYFGLVSFLSFQSILHDKNLFSPITYLPKGIIKGFQFMDTQTDNQAVLTAPSQFLGMVLPIFTDRKVFIARHVFTPDYLNKAGLADQFYLGKMEQNLAKDFLRQNNIGYVVLTSIENYPADKLYYYPFLKEVYKNTDVIVFKFTAR